MLSRSASLGRGRFFSRCRFLLFAAVIVCLPYASVRVAAAAGGHPSAAANRRLGWSQPAAQAGTTPDVVGQWGPLLSWPLVAVHAALLPTGNVLMWDAWEFGSTPSARLWNPVTLAFTGVPDPFSAMFCAGQVFLADGRQLVAGGHNGGGIGIVNTVIFDPQLSTWTRVADMNLARWYPTVTTLSDGRVLSLGGDVMNGAPALAPEVYDPSANTWTALSAAQLDMGEYPSTFVAPNGQVFVTHGSDQQSRYLDVGSQTWTTLSTTVPSWGTAAMYRPGKVMLAAGGSPPNNSDPAVSTTSVIDLNQPSPAWRMTAPMAYARAQHNLVLLPDGHVLAVGGAAEVSLISTNGVLPAELWDPTAETWTTMAALQDPRMYHSIALLLPDGRVLSAGGGRNLPAVDYPTAQVFSPPYLFKGTRPTISSAPAATTYGGTMDVQTPDAATIASVSFIRLSSVTHIDNMDQRFIPLSFTAGASSLTVQSPPDANMAPPGFYMLFIVNTTGVPSVAQIVQISGTSPTPTPIATSGTAVSTATNTATLTPTGSSTPAASGTPAIGGVVTLTAQLAASSDDANQDSNGLDLTSGTLWLGNASGASYAGLRFANLSVPSGASITSARLQVYSSQSQWLSLNFSLAAEAAGDSSTFSASSPPSLRPLTTQSVAHQSDTQWLANTWYALDEMAPVIQAVVGRPDWQSGNSLSVILTGTGSAWGRKFVQSWDGSPANAPRLVIVYTTTGGATGTPTLSPTPNSTSTPTSTATATSLSSSTATGTSTPSSTPTITSAAATSTATNTATPTPTASSTLAVSSTPTASSTATGSSTATASNTATASSTATASNTATASSTPTASSTATASNTATASSTPAASNTVAASNTATASNTAAASSTPAAGGVVTLTAQLAASSDDVNQDSNGLDLTSGTLWLGNASGASYTGLRFTNLAVPPGASITSAQLQVYSSQSQWLSLNLSLAAEASGNSSTFSAGSPPSLRPITIQSIAHQSDTQWLPNTWYALDEMAPVIQAVVGRPDWQSGNSLSVILTGTGSDWGRKFVQSWDGSPANAPRLVIVYTATTGGATSTPTRTPTPASTSTPTRTATATSLSSSTATGSNTPTRTPTTTSAATRTATATKTRTPTPTASRTPAASSTPAAGGVVTLTAKLAASSDDANQDSNGLALTSGTLWLGNASGASYAGLRFTNLAVPPGASITSARLQVYSSQSQWLSLKLSLAAEAAGNSSTFSAVSPPSVRPLTSQSVAHQSNTQWLANTWYALDEMAPVIQAVVSRPDWHSGNSLSVILTGTGSAWGRKFVQSWDGSPTNAPRLVITYTTTGGAASRPSRY